MEALRRLSLVSKVTIEIQNHWGIEDKTLAEFVIDLGESAADVDDFEVKLKDNGAESAKPFCQRLFELIQKMGGPKKTGGADAKASPREPAAPGKLSAPDRPLTDREMRFPGLRVPNAPDRPELRIEKRDPGELSETAKKLLEAEMDEKEREKEAKERGKGGGRGGAAAAAAGAATRPRRRASRTLADLAQSSCTASTRLRSRE